MAEAKQQLAGDEYEPQIFPATGEELPILDGNDAEQHNFVSNEYEQQALAVDGEQNFTMNESERFNEDESKQEEGFIQQKNFGEYESEDQLAENEAQQHFLETDSKQEFANNDRTETKEVTGDLHPEGKEEHRNSSTVGTEDKKWPGWPGESVFRMLVPAQKVGNIIGRKGECIKKIVEETRARIKVLDGPPATAERAVMVSAKEDPEASLPPAIDGLLRVHRRVVDGLEDDSAHTLAAPGGKVSTKLLVPATQAGSLIGKQGATVKSIQETSNCIVRVLGAEGLPIFALQDDRVVEVVGEPAAVHQGVELIASQLRKFLVDRTIIPLFEMQMQKPNMHVEHMPSHQTSWGPSPTHGVPPNAGGVSGYGPGPQYMPPSRQLENYYPPADMRPPAERQTHHGISTYGREPGIGGQASSNPQSTTSMITQVTQQMQIPLAYADAVIGASGSSISYIRRASGATVTIQETRGVPGEMTVEISGSASQVQAAQQLIQNFMAGAGATTTQTQTAAGTDQAYNQGYGSYAAPASTYGSPPTSTGYAGQPGAYGSVYGANYGY